MGRTINAATLAEMQKDGIIVAPLVKMYFTKPSDSTPEIVRLSGAYNNVYWNEGAGEETYIGLGGFGAVSALEETSDVQTQGVTFSLSGISDSDMLRDILATKYKGNPVFMWLAYLDETYTVVGDPVLAFSGRMDNAVIDFGNEASINVNATSRLADWENPKGGRYTHTYQQTYVDKDDYGFEYVEQMPDLMIYWGSRKDNTTLVPGDV